MRRFDDDCRAVVQGHRALGAVLEILPDIAGDFVWYFVLFERGAVHEDVVLALAIQKLHRSCFHVGSFQRITAFVRPVQRGAANQVFHLALVHRVALAGFDEVHFGYQIRFAVDLNLQSFAKIAGVVRCHGGLHYQSEKPNG